MLNRKSNCENKVSSRKSTILKTASSEKAALAKAYITALKKVGVLKKQRHQQFQSTNKLYLNINDATLSNNKYTRKNS